MVKLNNDVIMMLGYGNQQKEIPGTVCKNYVVQWILSNPKRAFDMNIVTLWGQKENLLNVVTCINPV